MKLTYNDDKHQYRLDGKLITGVSTIAGLLDDTSNLDKWKQRMVMLGLLARPRLMKQVEACRDDKWELNGLAWKAQQAARAGAAAERGTSMHKIVETHITGAHIDLDRMGVTKSFAREVVASWDRAMKEAGLEVVEEMTERIVVHPDVPCAGRLDVMLKRKTRGKLAIGDLKSGASAVDYPHKIAIQLACYANAPLLASLEGFDEDDGMVVAEEFEPMSPKMDKKIAYIIHMPVADDDSVPTAQIHTVDIEQGWKAAQISMAGLKWRKAKDLTKLVASQEITLTPASQERVDWVMGRGKLLKLVDGGTALIKDNWPEGVPMKPTADAPWTDADVDDINELLEAVEREVEAPFPVPDPAHAAAHAKAA